MKTLYVRTLAQEILFNQEILPQIVDGMFRHDGTVRLRPVPMHVRDWMGAVVRVGVPVGRNFTVRRDNYDVTGEWLVANMGNAMVTRVRIAMEYGADAAETFAQLYDNNGYNANPWPPEYETRVNVALAAYKTTLWRVRAVAEDSGAYGMADLVADLAAIGAAMRTAL